MSTYAAGASRRRAMGLLLLLLMATASLCSCGYGFKSGRLRPGLRTVAVPFFENRSREPDVEIELTEAIIAGLGADRTLQVVDEEQADAIVHGVLRKFEFVEAFFGSERQADEYKVRILVEVTMTDRNTQETIAGPKNVQGEGTYLTADGIEGETAAREVATKEIVEGILNMVIEEW
ncbi:MAG TPA: LptE family protein [Candidatus Krumholzibacteria bacterium]